MDKSDTSNQFSSFICDICLDFALFYVNPQIFKVSYFACQVPLTLVCMYMLYLCVVIGFIVYFTAATYDDFYYLLLCWLLFYCFVYEMSENSEKFPSQLPRAQVDVFSYSTIQPTAENTNIFTSYWYKREKSRKIITFQKLKSDHVWHFAKLTDQLTDYLLFVIAPVYFK